MRLAVFDTNVIVSAAIQKSGTPAKLLSNWVFPRQIQLATCPSIVWEYRDVLQRTKFDRYGFPPSWLDFLIQESLTLAEPSLWSHSLPDPKDAAFLSLAYNSGALLVTGNLKHFPADARQGVRVLLPADYLRELEERQIPT